MSGFMRSGSGLINQRRFYKVDRLIYCEGKSLSSENEPDMLFWETTISAIHDDDTVKIIPLGGRDVVLDAYSRCVSEEDLQNHPVHFCIDADYSRFEAVENKVGLIRTLGYSFESELFGVEQLHRFIDAFISGRANPKTKRAVSQNWSSISRRLSVVGRICAMNKLVGYEVGKVKAKNICAASSLNLSPDFNQAMENIRVSGYDFGGLKEARIYRFYYKYFLPGWSAMKYIYQKLKDLAFQAGFKRFPPYESFLQFCVRLRENMLPSMDVELTYYREQFALQP